MKYHLGASSDREFDGNNVHLSLTANPSHLEIVNPVVLGKARAKQAFTLRETPDAGRGHVLPLLMHGDAAFAGQGVVAECFALSGLKGYRIGGTDPLHRQQPDRLHDQPAPHRSSPYPSDVALMVEAPIFHVNGDDPEAVVFAAKVATEFRQQFGKDVVIDMFCYRRFGHNEGDDPTMTQPLMYATHQGPPVDPRALCRAPDRRGRRHAGRRRRLDRRVRRLPRQGVRGRQGLPRRQGRLAGRQVGRA